MKWADLTSPELDAVDRNVPVVLGIGAIEQHGPHLPLETDSYLGRAFLEEVDKAHYDHVLILPQVAVGCSAHHMDFAGSLSVSHETFSAYVGEIIGAAHSHGFRNVILFNSHGGNLGIGQVILERFGHQYPDCNVFFFTWWKIVADALKDIQESDFGGVGHACEFETSLVGHFRGKPVSTDNLPTFKRTPTFSWAEADMLNAPHGTYYRSFKEISGGTGVDGDPRFASTEKGAQIAGLVTNKLISMLSDIETAS